jgi:hypothetical protein
MTKNKKFNKIINDSVRVLKFSSPRKDKPTIYCLAFYNEKMRAWDCKDIFLTLRGAKRALLDFTIYTEDEFRRLDDKTKVQ